MDEFFIEDERGFWKKTIDNIPKVDISQGPENNKPTPIDGNGFNVCGSFGRLIKKRSRSKSNTNH